MQRLLLLSLAAAMLIQPSVSFASGGGGYSGGGGGGGFSNAPRAQRQVDQTYELGKAIYTGRAKGEPSLDYCVQVEGEKLPVKRKSIKSYKKSTYNDLANNLYDCNSPDELVSDSLTRDSFLYVVYYLNKRHKLDLRGS